MDPEDAASTIEKLLEAGLRFERSRYWAAQEGKGGASTMRNLRGTQLEAEPNGDSEKERSHASYNQQAQNGQNDHQTTGGNLLKQGKPRENRRDNRGPSGGCMNKRK